MLEGELELVLLRSRQSLRGDLDVDVGVEQQFQPGPGIEIGEGRQVGPSPIG